MLFMKACAPLSSARTVTYESLEQRKRETHSFRFTRSPIRFSDAQACSRKWRRERREDVKEAEERGGIELLSHGE